MEIVKNKLNSDDLYIKPVGRIDVNTATDFGCEVNDELDDIKNLVLDFEEVVYISSIGLRVLLELQKRMAAQGSMKLIHVRDEVMEIFNMTGFSKILNIL